MTYEARIVLCNQVISPFLFYPLVHLVISKAIYNKPHQFLNLVAL